MRSNPKNIFLAVFSAGVLFPLIVQAATFGLADIPSNFKFNKTLKLGETVTPDVSYLQFVLNQSADTQVADTGAGSLTGLTNYFGSKTQSAVNRFQEKYRDEILTPANIANPTGIVGANTRNKLNQILSSLFAGTYIDAKSSTPLASSLSSSASATTKPNLFSTGTNTSTANTQSTVKRTPLISNFSTFKALSGQLMSVFGAQFHPTKNTVYLGSVNVGDYPSLDNGTKITFKVPATLETGSYEMGIVNAYGTTSTGYMLLNVVKQATTATSTVAQTFAPSLITLYPNNSKNINDLVFLYGENFSFSNTLETNLGNTTVRSTNRKTLSFLISELPYYMEAFKKYKGQSINVIMRIRNENGLSKEQVVHVINFPNSDTPTVNVNQQNIPASFLTGVTDDAAETAQRAQLERLINSMNTYSVNSSSTTSTSTRATSTSSGNNSAGGGGSSDSSSSNSTSQGVQLDPATQQLGQVLGGSMLVQTVMQTSPIHKFVLDPLVSGSIGGSGSSGSSGSGSGGAAGGLAGAFGGGGGSSGGGTTGGGGGGGQITHFGGQITQVTYCTCSGTILLAIKDIPSKQTLQVFYRYGQSSLKANYNIFQTGINVLGGLTQGGGACEVYSGNSCSTEGNAQYTIDTLRGIGTGLTTGSSGGGAGGI